MRKTGKSQASLFALITFALMLLVFYFYVSNYFEKSNNPNTQIDFQYKTLRLKIASDGHYRVSGLVNGQAVVFMLDTGATGIALSANLAQQLGLKKMAKTKISTANGVVDAWLTHLNSIVIGGTEIRAISAVIMPNMDDEILLGMSYLRHFDWQQSNGELILKAN